MTAKLFNLQEEREARNVRAAEELRKGQSVRQIIHNVTYVPRSFRVAEEAVESLFKGLKEFGRGKRSGLEICASCKKPTDVRKDTPIKQRGYYIKGGGQLHPSCYEENLEATRQFAETLDRLRDY